MVVKTRRRRRAVHEIDEDHKAELLHGYTFFADGGFQGDVDAMRLAWESVRDEELSAFIAEHPGRRPFAEWLFHLIPQFGERQLTPAGRATMAKHRASWTQHGILHTQTVPPIQESEAKYLERHNLLLSDERKILDQQNAELKV